MTTTKLTNKTYIWGIPGNVCLRTCHFDAFKLSFREINLKVQTFIKDTPWVACFSGKARIFSQFLWAHRKVTSMSEASTMSTSVPTVWH